MSDFEKQSRKEAQACGYAGFVAFARAFNAKGEPDTEWRYSRDVLRQFDELCGQLLQLIKTGEIEVNPGHKAYCVARDARNNNALQTLIKRASKKTPTRASRS